MMERKEYVRQNYQFRLATEKDTPFLQAIDRSVSMPSQYGIELSFTHNPNFFTAIRTGSKQTQVIVCEDIVNNTVIGVGIRSIRDAYIDGQKQSIGYLSNLRSLPQERGQLHLLMEGYKYLKQLHGDNKVPFYITTVLEGNRGVQRLFTSNRLGLPIHEEYGLFATHLIPLYQRNPKISSSESVLRTTRENAEKVTTFINGKMSQYQFAPFYSSEDLTGESGSLPVFDISNLYVYYRDGNILGVMGVWDQSSFKQTILTKYGDPKIKYARPLYNAWSRIAGGLQLPKEGGQFRNIFAVMVAIRNDDPKIFNCLLDHIIAEWSQRGYTYLTLGLDRNHPLHDYAQKRADDTLLSRLYLAYWNDHKPTLPVKNKVFYLEAATL